MRLKSAYKAVYQSRGAVLNVFCTNRECVKP